MGKVIIVTGSNTGIGLGIVERLLRHELGEISLPIDNTAEVPVTFVLACRSVDKANNAKVNLIKTYFSSGKWFSKISKDVNSSLLNTAALKSLGEKMIQIVKINLMDPTSVFAACVDIAKRFKKIDILIFNAGILLVKKVHYPLGIYECFTSPTDFLRTGGRMLEQYVGEVTEDGVGKVYMANVLGHYIMVLRELEDLLSNAQGEARVLWVGSSSVKPEYFNVDDIQCIKG
ncbi:hypothetical protein HK096_010875, partial [Nowakowskiella sp. JEL0078]